MDTPLKAAILRVAAALAAASKLQIHDPNVSSAASVTRLEHCGAAKRALDECIKLDPALHRTYANDWEALHYRAVHLSQEQLATLAEDYRGLADCDPAADPARDELIGASRREAGPSVDAARVAALDLTPTVTPAPGV